MDSGVVVGNHNVLDLKAFVPARDYGLSRRFYADQGFTENWHIDQVAEFEAGGFRPDGRALAHRGEPACARS